MTGKPARSTDYDIRAAVVARLLKAGVARDCIRHEITLDTASSGGRADLIVVRRAPPLGEPALTAFEIKSGSDTLDRLADQAAACRRCSDYVVAVLDTRHADHLHKTPFSVSDRLLWDHEARQLRCTYSILGHWRSRATTLPHMARLLWRDEALCVSERLGGPVGPRVSREAAIDWMRERARLCDLRPLVCEALRARNLNRWEEAFWQRFDAETRTPEAAE